MNVSKIITLALKQLGVLAVSENANADEVADAVDCLNGLLAQWATHKLYVYKAEMVEIPLVGGTYSITSTELLSEQAWLDDDEIMLIRDVNDTATNIKASYQKTVIGFDISVHDKDAKVLKVKKLSLPSNLIETDDLDFPTSYQRPLILSLALEIAPMFGTEPSMLLMKNQANAIELLKRSNSTPLYVNNDLPVGVWRNGCY